MTFTCRHFDPNRNVCRLLKTGCVPVEQRLQENEEENRQKRIQAILDGMK